MSPHRLAVVQALLVTFLWSISWIIIKFGLQDIPPLTFAGLRYVLASLCLLPFIARSHNREAIRRLSRSDWLGLAVLGLVFITITQGAQFFALLYLPAVTLSLLLNFSTVLVALLGMWFLSERLTSRQWVGIGVFLTGVLIYFYPATLPFDQLIGLLIGLVAMLANAVSTVLSRRLNTGRIPPLVVTMISMGIGGIVLLTVGAWVQGIPSLSPLNVLAIVWLAIVNTALAFTLWNRTLRVLPAVESSLINSSMLIQIALLAWLFLGETITLREGVGLLVAGAGIVGVQWWRLRPSRSEQQDQ